MTQRHIKLSEYANLKSITYRTAWNRYNKGLIDGAYIDKTGHICVPTQKNKGNRCVIYARVSSNDRKESLINQQKRLEEFAVLKDYDIVGSYKEIASGMNDNRKILNKILENSSDWDVFIVENKDRLTRFGFNHIKTLLNRMDKDIIAVNQTDDDKEDLMKDLISIIYSFSARMYGLRRKKNKQEIIDFLENK